MSRIMGEKNEIRVVNIRMVREPSLFSETPVRTPQDVMKVIAEEMATYDREVVGILNLKSNGQVINMNICSIGTLNASLVSARETEKLAKAGEILDIRMIDHIIIAGGSGEMYSFREHGLMDNMPKKRHIEIAER